MQYIYISLISLMTLYPVIIVVWFMGFIVKFYIILKNEQDKLTKKLSTVVRTKFDIYVLLRKY